MINGRNSVIIGVVVNYQALAKRLITNLMSEVDYVLYYIIQEVQGRTNLPTFFTLFIIIFLFIIHLWLKVNSLQRYDIA
jgi:hypothetical protein